MFKAHFEMKYRPDLEAYWAGLEPLFVVTTTGPTKSSCRRAIKREVDAILKKNPNYFNKSIRTQEELLAMSESLFLFLIEGLKSPMLPIIKKYRFKYVVSLDFTTMPTSKKQPPSYLKFINQYPRIR